MTTANTIDTLTSALGIQLPSPMQPLKVKWKNDNQVELWVKRDDLIHPIISGNKWRKLRHTLSQTLTSKPAKIISFGGGHSNHLHALGYCCHKLNIPLLAIVRGDYSQNMTPMLNDLQGWGAQIEWVNKITYGQRADRAFISQLNSNYPNSLIIPEGGSQQSALQGVAEIVDELTENIDLLVAPVASGGTLAGLISATQHTQTAVLGMAVLKGHDYVQELVRQLLPQETTQNWQINSDFHFGGYAKKTAELIAFCQQFAQDTGIELEPIYSGKLFWGLRQLIENNYFPSGSKILALHTGGLQGKRT